MRDALHLLTGPRFGKRRRVGEMPTPDEHHRQMLGLPLGRRLFGPEIREAYKRAAKKVHPDIGGSERAFLELSAARDALLKAL
jgi:curved DNA-binding protein CbpA